MRRTWGWLRARDPGGFYLRRSVRAAVIVPVAFFIGSQVVANAQFATFAAFGSFSLLLFANFPGTRAARFGAYVTLAVAGALLVTIGTLAASPDWLAVAVMGVVAFLVLFVGVVSSMIAGGVQAALLALILAVLLPSARSDLPARLGGWGTACLIAIPVALFVWPPADQDQLRSKSGALCRALATMLHLAQPRADGDGNLVDPGGAVTGDPLVAMRASARELRATFRASAARTAAVSTGARAGIRLVEQLEWLAAAVTNACADAPQGWPEQGRRLRAAAAGVLDTCADLLGSRDAPDPTALSRLDAGLANLDAARAAVAAETVEELRRSATTPAARSVAVAAGEFARPLYAAHELGYAVALAAGTVSTIAAADSRSWLDRLRGRRAGTGAPSAAETATAAQHVASGHLDRHSVWLQNSVRGAVGLAVAVLLARVVSAQNAFWIGLGALSVLRSNALSTGSTVARALAGTVVGFAVGGVLVAVIGTTTGVLWALLPIVILIAASGPVTASFLAGQAAFTVFTMILFNIIAPAGWRIGVVRIEDVALGCAASLMAGVLFWPRGAGAALGDALAEAYRAGAAYFVAAVDGVVGAGVIRAEAGGRPAPGVEAESRASATRLDDALRQYLAEQGAKHVPLEDVAVLAGGAARLRLAGMAVADLAGATAPVDSGARQRSGSAALVEPGDVLSRRAHRVAGWYAELADGFTSRGGSADVAAPDPLADESFLDVVLPRITGCGEPGLAAQAEQLLWTGQYLGDVDQLRSDLVEPAGKVRAARARAWWRR